MYDHLKLSIMDGELVALSEQQEKEFAGRLKQIDEESTQKALAVLVERHKLEFVRLKGDFRKEFIADQEETEFESFAFQHVLT